MNWKSIQKVSTKPPQTSENLKLPFIKWVLPLSEKGVWNLKNISPLDW